MRNSIVVGCGRSGTSMLTGAIARAGAFVGDDPYPARDSNPKGFFEAADVNGINEWLIASVEPRGSDLSAWQRWLAILPVGVEFRVPPEIRERMQRLASRTPYCFKDPRFSYTLPAWRDVLGDARHLCIFRDPAATAASIVKECESAEYLASARARSELGLERAFDVWSAMYRHVLESHRSHGEWLFVHYDQVLSGEAWDAIERFVEAPIARDFPEARLNRSRAKAPVPGAAQELYAELCDLAGMPRGVDTRARAKDAAPRAGDAGAHVLTAQEDRAPESNVSSSRAGTQRSASAQPIVAPPASAAPEISVILCTYDRRAVLAESLASFERQTAPRGTFELIVVNDGSKDGTREWLDARGLAIPGRIVHRENGGLAAARNTGIALARGRRLLFVNDDTIAFADLVAEHMRAHASLADERISVLGTFEQPARALDNALMRCLERTTKVFCYAAMEPGRTYDWNRFWTCNVSASRELVLAAGGFDERFRRYGCEDTDLAIRLEVLGAKVHYHAAARAHHRHLLDLAALKRRQRTVAQAYVSLFAKHPRAMDHADWKWVKALSLADCERFVDQRLPDLPGLEEAAAALGSFDIGALSELQPTLARSAEVVIGELANLVDELNTIWWRQGFVAGLVELGVTSFAELAPAEPWPLASEAPSRVIAWPDWSAADLQFLFEEYGPAIADREDVCLVLRHDRAIDPPIEVARRALADAYARTFRSGESLDVLVLDDELQACDARRIGCSVRGAVLLPSSRVEPRRAWLARVGAPSVDDREALALCIGATGREVAAAHAS